MSACVVLFWKRPGDMRFFCMVFLGVSFIGIVFYLIFVEFEFVNDKIEKVNVKCLKILKKS